MPKKLWKLKVGQCGKALRKLLAELDAALKGGK